MQKIKIQHYVPRFYLRNFSKKDGKQYIVNCFDKIESKQFVENVDQIASEKYFYDIDRETEQLVEKELSKNEEELNCVYNKLISKKSLYCLNWKEKESLARFAAIQDIRTREMRETIKGIGNELKKFLSEKPTSEELERQLKEVATEQTARRVHLKILIETLLGENHLVEMFLSLKWVLSDNNTKMPLWTSDHPVNRFNPMKQSPLGNLGLLSKGIEISFPLTPKLGLSFCDPVEYFYNPDHLACIKDNVLFYNTLQVRSCTRHVFSRDNDFSIARKWLTEYPENKNQKRKRIQAQIFRKTGIA
jgi:hypothetical protein